MSFVSSKGNIFCKIELYKIFAIINRAIKGLHCIQHQSKLWIDTLLTITVFMKFTEKTNSSGYSKYPWHYMMVFILIAHL